MVKIDVTPHTSLLTKIGAASFSISQSISELLANGFDALPPDRSAHFEVKANLKEIRVADNAQGMTREVLKKAVRMAWPMREVRHYGKEAKSEFGLGMKTACASLGRWWAIETIPAGEDKGWRVAFDLEEWSKGRGSWEADLKEVEGSKITLPSKADGGTVVTVRKLKVKPVEDILKAEIGRAYAPHIRGKDRIFLNGKLIEVPKPELVPGTRQDVDITVEGVRIRGWGALLKVGGLTQYGFHWYRKGQLIEAFDKSFLPRHPNYRQVTGELHADEMPVNFNKRGFDTESAAWKQAIEELEEHFQPLKKQAAKKVKEQAPDPWTGGQIRDSVDTMARVGESLSVKVLTADPPSEYLDRSIVEALLGEDESDEKDEKVAIVSQRHPIVVGPLKVRWRHVFKPMGEEGPIADYAMDSPDELLVVSNLESPFLDLVEDRSIVAILNVAETITRYLIEEQGFDYGKAGRFRDAWLVTASATLIEAAMA